MSTRPLTFNTNVIYNGQVAKIRSISKTENVIISLVSDKNNTPISVRKDVLKPTPHDTGELIKYKDTYYLISSIYVENNKLAIYNLSFVKNKTEIIKTIKSNDKHISNIDKNSQEKTISYLKFIDRYNLTISFLIKKRGNIFKKLEYKDIDEHMENLFKRCKLTMTQLNKIEHTLKKTQFVNLQIQHIYVNPFDFITQDYQLITYDKAEKICSEYALVIDFKIKLEKWSYNLFLSENKAFYIPKWMYDKEMKKFCNDRQENPNNFEDYIKKILIDKVIGKDRFGRDAVYKTTQYLFNFEKKTTDLAIKLFSYDKKEYDIPRDKIEEKINLYEQKNRRELNNLEFSLETEQKESVINSVKNKLSIITGPPGTGKTEILKCINFVLTELYEEEMDNDNDNDLHSTLDTDETTTHESESDEFEYCDEYESDNEDFNNEELNNEELNKFVNPQTIGLLAPTGLAYVNMQRSQKAKHYNINLSGTCHRTLYQTIPNIKKHRRKCSCEGKCIYNFNPKLFELDEVSMLDIFIFYDILKECMYFNARLIMLGDVEQLPSIGPGKVLQQLINSNAFTVTMLTKIKRQNTGALVNNILKMSREIITPDDLIDDTMQLFSTETLLASNEIDKGKIANFIKENNLNKDNTKFIVNFNKLTFIFNTTSLNNILQNIFNPIDENYEHDIIPSTCKYENGFTFRVKDKIIRTENDYSSEKMRANGEEASILSFDGKYVTIKYSGTSDKPEEIGVNELYENFKLNYCVTVHKSQGSQYTNVVFLIEPKCSYIEKKAIYTAISRAREKCLIISTETDFVNLQNNNKSDNYKKVTLFMEVSNIYNVGLEI
jgi:energy-coupling factor transporter ATP-binding protein EcfA2